MRESSVIINGHIFYVHPRGRQKTAYCFEGMYFETEEELFVAEMLSTMQIPFLHHVDFVFKPNQNDSQPIIWCPDFVLGRPYRWIGPICNGSVIVGLEVKRAHIRGKPRTKSRQLLIRLGIPILLISRPYIEPYYNDTKQLPLKPLKDGRPE